MTTWGELEVGSRIIYDGGEYADLEHVVTVLKRGGLSVRAVLAPVVEEKAAKIAVRVRLSDEVQLAEGSAAPDRAGTAIASVLNAEEVAIKREGDDVFVCAPASTTTVASHLRIMHGVDLTGLEFASEDDLIVTHRELHDAPFHQPTYPHRHEASAS